MTGFLHIDGFDYMIVDEVIAQRIEDAFDRAKTPRRSILVLRTFLCMMIGPRIGSGSPTIFSIEELCEKVYMSDRTVKKWLKELERVGFISKRRGGTGKVELQLQPDFLYTGPFPEELERYYDEELGDYLAELEYRSSGLA